MITKRLKRPASFAFHSEPHFRRRGSSMFIRGASIRLKVPLAFTSVTLFVTSAYGQSSPSPPDRPRNEVAAAQGSQLSNPGKKFLPKKPRSIDLEDKGASVLA